jgi:hypothetical protein
MRIINELQLPKDITMLETILREDLSSLRGSINLLMQEIVPLFSVIDPIQTSVSGIPLYKQPYFESTEYQHESHHSHLILIRLETFRSILKILSYFKWSASP